jgi:hypothetical protein
MDALKGHKKFVMETERPFEDWFIKLLCEQESCLLRDVLRNQKLNLKEEWKRVEPMNGKPDRDECGRVKRENVTDVSSLYPSVMESPEGLKNPETPILKAYYSFKGLMRRPLMIRRAGE